MQDVEDVGEQHGVRGLVPWQRLAQPGCAGHRERQDHPVLLGESECMFGGLVRRALVTELAVGKPASR